MKKMMLLIMLTLLGAGAAMIQSCRKDNAYSFGKEGRGVDNKLLPGTDAEIEQRIRSFKQQCAFLAANPGMKNTTLLHYNDACWLIEASLNYTFGFPGESTKFSRIDTCILLIPRNSTDSVSFQSAAFTYQSLIDSLQYFYEQVIWSGKKILLADLALLEPTDPGFIRIKFSVIIGDSQENVISFGNPYDVDDYWFYGGNAGKCGPYFPSCFGSDAAREIEQYQEWFKPVYPKQPGEHVYYTDIEPIIVPGNTFLNPADLNLNDNQLDYLMFYNDPALPNFHDCLDPAQMWFYLQGLHSVVADDDKARSWTSPPLKDFISLTLMGNIRPTMCIEHIAYIRYGFRHVSYDPQFPVSPHGL